MYPARLVAEHEATVHERRRSPDRCLCLVAPDDLAFVRSKAIQITIARADVYSSIRDDWARPESTLLFAGSTERLVLPKQLAVTRAEAINNAILRGCIDFAFVNSGRGIGVSADARLPNC